MVDELRVTDHDKRRTVELVMRVAEDGDGDE
jgi:hypothetical protein